VSTADSVSTADAVSTAGSTPVAGPGNLSEGRRGAAPEAGSAFLAAIRLTWLHWRSRRAPAALAAFAACGMALWAALHYNWWLRTGHGAADIPMLIEGCAAAIIAVATHSPFGEPERVTARWLPLLRLLMALALSGTAIGLLALGAAAANNPPAGVYLTGGILGVAENVMGFTGIGLIFSLVTGGLIAFIGPLAFTAVCQFALAANYSEPLTWAARPATDRGGWIAAIVVYAVGLAFFHARGARTLLAGE
jgi:hypothetical protein